MNKINDKMIYEYGHFRTNTHIRTSILLKCVVKKIITFSTFNTIKHTCSTVNPKYANLLGLYQGK